MLSLFFAMRPLVASEALLPGHALTAKEASAKADKVFTGQLVSLDPVNTKATHGQYIGKVVYLDRPANGMTPPIATQNGSVLTPPIVSDLGIPMTMTVAVGEVPPQVGNSYIFYAKADTRRGANGFSAVKLTPVGSSGVPNKIFGGPVFHR